MTVQSLQTTRNAWDRIAPGYDAHVTPTHHWLADEGLRRAGLQPGMSVLDIAAGTGALSIPAARHGAHVLAVDLSPTMLERLKQRASAEDLSVETRVMDGHALEFDDGQFDLVASQFGVMLFPDMPRGVREMVRVARPGGRVLMNVYGHPSEVEFIGFFIRAIQSVIPGFEGPPMDPMPLPFQLHDPDRLRGQMAEAGLVDVRVETITETLTFPDGAALWGWLLNSNPIPGQILEELGLDARQCHVVRDALGRLVRERAGDDPLARLTNPVHIGVGVKPRG